jgi:hypothetical protein
MKLGNRFSKSVFRPENSIKYWLCYTSYMPPYYSDTDPKMEALQVQFLRSAPPWKKMELLASLNASARRLALTGLRRRFPQDEEAEIRRRLAVLLLGPDLAQKVYSESEDDA